MKKIFQAGYVSIVFCMLVGLHSCNKRSGNVRVLVFSKTAGYYHQSIPTGVAAIMKLGKENNFEVDTTTNAAWFNEDSLQKYAAVIFLNTTAYLPCSTIAFFIKKNFTTPLYN
jgi:hypothetical protein